MVGVATGEHDGRPCVVVLVQQPTAEILDRLPRDVGGFPVDVRPTGGLEPLDDR